MRLTEQEKLLIKDNYKSKTPEEIAALINSIVIRKSKRTKQAVDLYVKLLQKKDLKSEKGKEYRLKQCEKDYIEYKAKSLVSAAYERTKKKEQRLNTSLPFDITVDFVKEKLNKGLCEVTGLPLSISKYKIKDKYESVNPMSASLDQIIAGAGYTKDNVRVVGDFVNKALSDKPDDVMLPLLVKAACNLCKLDSSLLGLLKQELGEIQNETTTEIETKIEVEDII